MASLKTGKYHYNHGSVLFVHRYVFPTPWNVASRLLSVMYTLVAQIGHLVQLSFPSFPKSLHHDVLIPRLFRFPTPWDHCFLHSWQPVLEVFFSPSLPFSLGRLSSRMIVLLAVLNYLLPCLSQFLNP